MDGSRNHLCILSFLRKFKTNRKESKYAEMEIYKQRPNRPSTLCDQSNHNQTCLKRALTRTSLVVYV